LEVSLLHFHLFTAFTSLPDALGHTLGVAQMLNSMRPGEHNMDIRGEIEPKHRANLGRSVVPLCA